MKFWIFIILVLEQKGVTSKRIIFCTSQFENRPPPPPPPQTGIWLEFCSIQWGIWPKMRPTQSGIWLLCQNGDLQCRQQKDFVICSAFCCAPHSWVIAPIFTVMLEHLRKPVKCGGRGWATWAVLKLTGTIWTPYLMRVWSNITLMQWVSRCKNFFKSISVVKNVWIGLKIFYCS